MEKIKLGIIGAGWVAEKHLEVIHQSDAVVATGIFSRTKTKAERLAKDFQISHCAESIEQLLEEAKPDALMVLISEDQVLPVASFLIPLGLPLFIEKPAGLTPQENRQLADLAKKYSLRTMVGFNRRFYSIFHKGLEIVRQHGPLLGIAVEGHERFWRVKEMGKFPQKVLDAWIFVNSTHTIDLLRFFAGEIKNIQASSRSYIESNGDQFVAVVEFESGALGQYQAHWYSPGGWRVVLYGDGVTVEFKPLEKGQWIDKDFVSHEIVPDAVDVTYKPGFFKQLMAFQDLIKKGVLSWPALDLEGSYKTMLLAEQMSSNSSDILLYKSHKTTF
jgi:predicted dehydrogenase